MNKEVFLGILLIISLALGGGLSYVTVISQEPSVPETLTEEITENLKLKTRLRAQELGGNFREYEAIVSIIKNYAELIYENDSLISDVTSYYHNDLVPLIPQLTDISFDEKYGRDVSYSASAYKIAPRAFNEDYLDEYINQTLELTDPLTQVSDEVKNSILKSAKLDHVFLDLYEAFPEIVWEYMGFDAGFHRSYPWHSYSRTYDPTQRPWYISTITGSKDVVFVVDRSGSMEGSRMEEAKAQIISMVNALGPRDRFNILTFSDKVDNFIDSLEVPSPDLLTQASEFVNDTRPAGTTDLNAALVQSIRLLDTYGSKEKIPVIILLTDGKPTTGTTNNDTIIENVRNENGVIEASIITLAIGNEVDFDLMNTIADENTGKVFHINETRTYEEAKIGMNEFLSSEIKRDEVMWGFPFIDASGQGMILTGTAPVYKGNEIIGVAAADFKLDSVLDEIDDLDEGEYAFIYDIGGITVLHDDFANLPYEEWNETEIRQPIELYESDDNDFVELKELAKKGVSSAGMVTYAADGFGTEQRIIAMSPIGNTSMILAIGGKLTDLLGDSVNSKIDSLYINQLTIVPGIGVGFIAAIVIFVIFESRNDPKEGEGKEDKTDPGEPEKPAQDNPDTKEETK